MYYLLSGSEKGFFRFLGFLHFGSCEVIVFNASDVDSGKVNLGDSRDDIGLIDSLKRNTVDLVWAGNKQKAGLELLKEDNSLTLESTSQKDQNLSRSDIFSEMSWLWSLVFSDEVSLLIISRVPLRDSVSLCGVDLFLFSFTLWWH